MVALDDGGCTGCREYFHLETVFAVHITCMLFFCLKGTKGKVKKWQQKDMKFRPSMTLWSSFSCTMYWFVKHLCHAPSQTVRTKFNCHRLFHVIWWRVNSHSDNTMVAILNGYLKCRKFRFFFVLCKSINKILNLPTSLMKKLQDVQHSHKSFVVMYITE